MRIILASASPRRKELLARLGWEFEVIPSQGEEIITKEIPSEIVTELAAQKARAVELTLQKSPITVPASQKQALGEKTTMQLNGKKTEMQEEEFLVIGADTIVVYEGQILGKPSDPADACCMLRMLSGKTHQVYTGVCLIKREEEKREEYGFFEKTDVTFYPMTEKEIQEYVSTGDPLDKAGAYGIQGICGKYIRGIQGDYNNVVGLPIARLYHEMQSFLPA